MVSLNVADISSPLLKMLKKTLETDVFIEPVVPYNHRINLGSALAEIKIDFITAKWEYKNNGNVLPKFLLIFSISKLSLKAVDALRPISILIILSFEPVIEAGILPIAPFPCKYTQFPSIILHPIWQYSTFSLVYFSISDIYVLKYSNDFSSGVKVYFPFK